MLDRKVQTKERYVGSNWSTRRADSPSWFRRCAGIFSNVIRIVRIAQKWRASSSGTRSKSSRKSQKQAVDPKKTAVEPEVPSGSGPFLGGHYRTTQDAGEACVPLF